ncbi:class I SAM-dependent methyltransferase [candidate division WWE3 bacterium]|jgi:16S rRNA (adenine(1408)-N(1))-methyltransferase|uniref:Class I SAM-dependent methyltransferase n=1 Tax=candidate division WWE3 bacterium TaxID=2053526 RepID=A0A3A4ZCP3_UNCKA|nr:MAG: class I SAM-dependent methyltransferase [candidate division WWE3 bacterium]
MRIVKGNKTVEINEPELNKIIENFPTVVIDLGTGDGRFVYKNALKKHEIFFIGIDPSEKQLQIYSKKAVRKKLINVLFVVSSVEQLPPELRGKADKVYIILPWGTLLQKLVKPDKLALSDVAAILKKGGTLETVLGYSPNLEPSESKRLDLPEINISYLRNETIPAYRGSGLTLMSLNPTEPAYLRKLESTWGKKIGLTQERPLFIMQFTRE